VAVADGAGPDVAGQTPPRKASASGPAIRYLNSGELSKRPALFRIAKYSNFSDSWYFWATR
jgi:hypothetical protein